MSFIDDQISQMRQRLKELEPAVRESEILRRSIIALEREKASAASGGSPKAGKYESFMRFQEHLAAPIREEQIRQILREDPSATNRKIGEKLGITGARVGQIRKEMKSDGPETASGS